MENTPNFAAAERHEIVRTKGNPREATTEILTVETANVTFGSEAGTNTNHVAMTDSVAITTRVEGLPSELNHQTAVECGL